MTNDIEIERLCANVSDEQRGWLNRYMFREWCESFLEKRLDARFALDGSDDVPPTEWWWGCIAYWYKQVTGNDAPELECTEPGCSPSGIHLNG